MIFTLSACQNSGTKGNKTKKTETLTLENKGQEDTDQEKILIAYFSLWGNVNYPEGIDANTSASILALGDQQYGTTEYVGKMIQENVGGDLFLIQTEKPYSADFDAVVEQNHEEAAQDILPALVESDLDISGYDTIFIGYPIWATDAPQAIYSFIQQYDFNGKTVIPFCTHGGYGAGESYRNIAEMIPDAKMLDGLAVEAEEASESEENVSQWLSEIGMNHYQFKDNAQTEERKITVTAGDTVFDAVLYDTALADEISQYFPLTVSMSEFGSREYYGGVDFYPEHLEGGQRTFENGEITYCEAHHSIAVFYAQSDDPTLSVDVIPIGKVISDLEIFEELPGNVEITFEMTE